MDKVIDFAGLTQGELNLIVFQDSKQLSKLLTGIGIKVKGDEVLDPETGAVKTCPCCEVPITLSNLGNIMPGSTLIFCDDPFCLAGYVSEHVPPAGA